MRDSIGFRQYVLLGNLYRDYQALSALRMSEEHNNLSGCCVYLL